jgi:hypothetical protein
MYVCVCMCVDMTYGTTIDRGSFPFQKMKKRPGHIPWGYPRLLIRCHAPRLSGWRPSSAVYHLGGGDVCGVRGGDGRMCACISFNKKIRSKCILESS